MQAAICDWQKSQEDIFKRVSALRPDHTVMLLDRACIDGKMFCSAEEWSQVLDLCKETEESLLARYDLCVHLTTCADGRPEFYQFGPGSNNPSRFHTPDQAAAVDRACRDTYDASSNYQVVGNFDR
jgi:hypothetical protein